MKNIRKILITIMLILFVSGAFSQVPLELGKKQINVGAGIGFIKGFFTPIYVGWDYALYKDITVGFELSLNASSPITKWANTIDYKLGLYLTGNYHFNRILKIPSNFDLYAGLGLRMTSSNFFLYIPSELAILNIFQAGGRYFFSKSWAIHLEAIGLLGFRLGATYKF